MTLCPFLVSYAYLVPRFQVLYGSTSQAVALVAFVWSFQHAVMSLTSDPEVHGLPAAVACAVLVFSDARLSAASPAESVSDRARVPGRGERDDSDLVEFRRERQGRSTHRRLIVASRSTDASFDTKADAPASMNAWPTFGSCIAVNIITFIAGFTRVISPARLHGVDVRQGSHRAQLRQAGVVAPPPAGRCRLSRCRRLRSPVPAAGRRLSPLSG